MPTLELSADELDTLIAVFRQFIEEEDAYISAEPEDRALLLKLQNAVGDK